MRLHGLRFFQADAGDLIQGLAAMFVIGLDGDYYNVMGLPVCPLAMILRKFGVKLLGC